MSTLIRFAYVWLLASACGGGSAEPSTLDSNAAQAPSDSEASTATGSTRSAHNASGSQGEGAMVGGTSARSGAASSTAAGAPASGTAPGTPALSGSASSGAAASGAPGAPAASGAAASSAPGAPTASGAAASGGASGTIAPGTAASAPGTSTTPGTAASGAPGTSTTSGTSPSGAAASGGTSSTTTSGAAASGGTGAPPTTGAPAAGSSAPTLGQDCARDPLASEKPYGSGFFQQFRGLMGCTAATDLALYRTMLPAKFDMPADPQVCFYTLDFMISGVGPYHEAALLLPIEYAGMSGKYVLTMPLDNTAATSGGRAVGFPKYMTDVTLTQSGNDWTATIGKGMTDLQVQYTAECVAEDVFLWPDFINLTPIPSGETSSKAFLPPRDGRALMVPAEHLTGPKFFSLRGSAQLSIGDHLPWNGLVDETKPFTAYLTTFKGGIDLGNRPLD